MLLKTVSFFSCSIALICLLSLNSAHAEPVRIMPVGDSITDNSPGYKGHLYQLLKEGGYDVLFVGPKKAKAADGGQLDHAGHGGFTIGPGPSKGDEWTGGKGNIYINIETYLKSDPQIILLLIGTNEFFNIGKLQPDLNPNVDGPKRLAALVDRIHELKPDVKVLVGSVLPVGWDANFAKGFNTAAPELLKDKPNTFFVDTAKLTGFTKGDWISDNLHPSDAGNKKLAQVWFEALKPHLTVDEGRKAAAAEAKAKAEQEKASAVEKKKQDEAALANRIKGPTTPIWDFAKQKPTYAYLAWNPLEKSGAQTELGWKIDALPDGGLGIVLSSPLDLTGYVNLLLRIKKEEGGSSDLFVKLMCEPGDRSFTVPASAVTAEGNEIVLVLEKPSSGTGDLSKVKQIQIQGNFNKSQKSAYTLQSLEAEKAPAP